MSIGKPVVFGLLALFSVEALPLFFRKGEMKSIVGTLLRKGINETTIIFNFCNDDNMDSC